MHVMEMVSFKGLLGYSHCQNGRRLPFTPSDWL